ncbi:hypothetical protein SCUCBS95973_002659 [Sporothrix curviconia]|uniref:Uncharacterized protein n=1 Tax=Sporothrix curviconia TaxID=1260050 RepID=A0ABP0B919_9PEZI
MTITSILRRTFYLFLAVTPCYVAVVHAQSEATGDLTLAAPYGIPPAVFNASISRTVRQSAVYVPGYNLSAPEGFGPSGNGSAVVGWQLGVAVADNVPLTNAAAPGINTAKVIDATTLWLQAPLGVEFLNSTAWKLCATVFPYVNMSAAMQGGENVERRTAVSDSSDSSDSVSGDDSRQNNGNCGAWLTDQCAAALNENALAYGTGADGSCYNMTVPQSCTPFFMHGHGNGTAVVLDKNTLADGRFYAWGSAPTSGDDTAALNSALSHVWPVLLTWIQFGQDGKVFTANSHVSCLAASSNGTGTATERGTFTSAGKPGPVPNQGLAALFATALALLM